MMPFLLKQALRRILPHLIKGVRNGGARMLFLRFFSEVLSGVFNSDSALFRSGAKRANGRESLSACPRSGARPSPFISDVLSTGARGTSRVFAIYRLGT